MRGIDPAARGGGGVGRFSIGVLNVDRRSGNFVFFQDIVKRKERMLF